ncbi:MAG: peptidoglycan-associated lipoprotein Pal [Betaproteobacteria bacterium]|jgi:peptidoglycan-associated lipoprotein|nr:MAG: peptidoglycan-associated lipoprotein Pal [Betaproteobacteria bacterium]TMH81494.1 MAG: peptidoglycan-associated lipoprotein Pal [Betaproteobacteria bacterium]
MKKTLFSALTLVLLYGCASTPVEPEKPAEPSVQTPAPPVAPPLAARPVQPAPQVDLTKRSVFYDYDKYDIKDEYRPVLQAHGKYLAENRGKKMLIQGNCDERGSREYNIALGQRRAEGVKRMLVLMGATETQVEPVSLGEEKPRCTDHNEGCWSQNRRSDMLYGGEY